MNTFNETPYPPGTNKFDDDVASELIRGGGSASPQTCHSGTGGNGRPQIHVFSFNSPIDPQPDTPRCNAAFALGDTYSRAAFARQLERELATVTKQRDEQRKVLQRRVFHWIRTADEWRDKAEAYRLAAARRDEEMNHQVERAARWRQCAESLAKHVRAEFDDEAAELKRFYELKNREDGVQS